MQFFQSVHYICYMSLDRHGCKLQHDWLAEAYKPGGGNSLITPSQFLFSFSISLSHLERKIEPDIKKRLTLWWLLKKPLKKNIAFLRERQHKQQSPRTVAVRPQALNFDPTPMKRD